MKRSTCKVLLFIAIFLFIISFYLSYSIINLYIQKQQMQIAGNLIGINFPLWKLLVSSLFLSILNPIGWAVIILLIIALIKWNSEEKEKIMKKKRK